MVDFCPFTLQRVYSLTPTMEGEVGEEGEASAVTLMTNPFNVHNTKLVCGCLVMIIKSNA